MHTTEAEPAARVAPPAPANAPEPAPGPGPEGLEARARQGATAPARDAGAEAMAVWPRTPRYGEVFRRLAKRLHRFAARHALAWLVLLPTLAAALYYGLMASDVYTSESRFVVRTPSRQGSSSGLGAMLQGAGLGSFAKASDDAFTVNDFILSRDALATLNDELGLKAAYGAPAVDRLTRFAGIDPDDSIDALYRFHLKQLELRLDTVSSITTLTTQAFDAAMAQAINERLLTAAEAFVNELNERARADMIRYASDELAAAEKRARSAAGALAAFRNAKSVADPERQTALQLAQVSKLQDDLIATQGTLAQLRAATPENPQIAGLQARLKATQAAIASENSKITGGNSLASKSVEFQRVALDQELANRQLASALVALQDAKNDAQRKKLYLERIAQPNRPETAERPKRLRNVLSVLVVSAMFAACLSVVLAGVREHRS
jgi:capsular polysaccharide transport system permease protein